MMTIYTEISKSFNHYAVSYEPAALMQREVGVRLLDRLHYLKHAPSRILDLGCGTGFCSHELVTMFPKSQIIGLDNAKNMLRQASKKRSWRKKWSLVLADMHFLPFPSGSFDLVFANQVIHWGSSLPNVFREINRVMSTNGCFMFTTLGPDSFKELKTAWLHVNQSAHANEFADMHDVGDCLVSEYFLEPVMDMEWITVQYETLDKLLKGVKAQGVRNINSQRNPGLTGKSSWKQFVAQYELLKTPNGKYPLSYEVVYGHAWKGEKVRTERGLEVAIPISRIGTRA